MPSRLMTSYTTKQGFTLIELLVAIVVLAIGLLGMAGLQTTGLQTNQSAYHRSQATLAISDIAERMRSNKDGVNAKHYDNINSEADTPKATACISSKIGCNAQQLAQHDIYEWIGLFKPVAKNTQTFIPVLPGATASVVRVNGSNTFNITVGWTETDWDRKKSAAPATGQTAKIVVQKQLSMPIEIF